VQAKEEKKAWPSRAGYDMSSTARPGGHQFQNANNSVRVTDEFMKKHRRTKTGAYARVGGTVLETVKRVRC